LWAGAPTARRHAQASAVSLKATQDDARIRITIDDDGIGFAHAEPPWAIASRVAELGGNVRLVRENRSGAHMEIEMKAA
jgi:signal transduction histidine kinase